MEQRISRRRSLAALAGLAAGTLGLETQPAGASGTGPAAVASGLVTCVLTPEMTEGPFYLPGERIRRNITEGRPGTPLTLELRVVDVSRCTPIERAAVDVWHCDALGVYSGVQGNSGTFMRGIQRTDAHGLATFVTVYPGWYTGRAVHVHVKVHLGGTMVHTGQLFFSDALTDAVYRRAPYDTRGARDTRNATDSIFRNGGSRSLLAVTKRGAGYVGSISMGVHR